MNGRKLNSKINPFNQVKAPIAMTYNHSQNI